MKLPKNPTEAQILAVTGLVIKSIYTRGTVAVQTLGLDSQGRLTGIFLGDGVRFRYTIDNGILSYAPVNPKDLPSEEGISLSEDALDFARLKIAGNTKQEKKCKVGYACGYSCISQNRNCKKALPGQAKNGAEWVKMQREKESEASQKNDRPTTPPKRERDIEGDRINPIYAARYPYSQILPGVKGTKRQQKWALEIRENALRELWESGFHGTWDRFEEDIPKLPRDAGWWIDNRNGINAAVNERLGFTYNTPAGSDY